MRFPVVLFDFDGTIVDSGPVVRASMQHAVREVLGRKLDPADLPAIYRLGDLETQMRSLDEQHASTLVDAYRDVYPKLGAGLTAFPGMVPLLETLKGEGRRLGIVSSKRRDMVVAGFDLVPLAHLFDVIVGAHDTKRHKPFGDPILFALERLDASPADAVYVGDAPVDVEAARAAGVHSIAVTWGGLFPLEQTLAARPDTVVATAEELLAVL